MARCVDVCEQIHMLRCHHLGCASTFRSQHGRTYHFRATHVNTNSRPIEVPVEPAVNPLNSRAQRKEHPHLTGTCTVDVELLSHTNQYNEEPFHVTPKATSCHQAPHHIPGKVHQKTTGHPSKMRSSSNWLTSSIAAPNFLRPTSTPFSNSGPNRCRILIPLHPLRIMKNCMHS